MSDFHDQPFNRVEPSQSDITARSPYEHLSAIGEDSADNQKSTTLVTQNEDGSVLERLEFIQKNLIPDVSGLCFSGTCDTGMTASTTTIVCADLSGYTDDFFNSKYYMIIIKNANSVGNAPENELKQITDYTSSSGTFVVNAFSANVEEGDKIFVIHRILALIGWNDAANDMTTSSVVQDIDGSILERSESVIKALQIVAAAGTGFEEDGSGPTVYKSLVAAKGTTTGAGTTATFVDTGRTEGLSYWIGQQIMALSGSAAFQVRTIVADTGAGTLTVEPLLSAAPGSGIEYMIFTRKASDYILGDNTASNAYSSSNVTSDIDGSIIERSESVLKAMQVVAAAGTGFEEDGTGPTLYKSLVAAKGTTTGAGTTATFVDTGRTEGASYWVGQQIMALSGSAGFQVRTIVADDGAGTLTVEPLLSAAPGTPIEYMIFTRKASDYILGDNTANNAYDSSSVAQNADGSVLERLEYIQQNLIPDVGGLVFRGTCDTGMAASATTIVCAHLSGYGNNFFDTKYYMQILKNTNSVGNAPEREVRQITAYTSSTGTFTVTAFSANVEETDEILVMHECLVAVGRDDNNNTFSSANVVANSDGSVLERLEHLLIAVGGTTGTTSALGTTTTAVDTVARTEANDYWNGAMFVCVDGANAGLARPIYDFDNASGTLYFEPAFPNAVAASVNYIILNRYDVARILGDNSTDNSWSSSLVVPNPDGSVLERLEFKQHQNGGFYWGSCTTKVDTAHTTSTDLIGYGNSNFASGDYWIRLLYTSGAAVVGETKLISAYTSATGAFTHAAFSVALEVGDLFIILHKSQMLLVQCADTSDPVDMTPEVTDHSPLANLLTNDGDTSGYDRRTHSQEAQSNALGITVGGTLTGFEGDGTGTNVFKTLIAVQGSTTGAGSTSTIVDAARTEGANYWIGHKVKMITGGAAGQVRTIVADTGAGTLTVEPLLFAASGNGSDYVILANKASDYILGDNTANNAYDSSSVVANQDGSALERLDIAQHRGAFAYEGKCSTEVGVGATTVLELAGYGDDYFNSEFYLLVTWTHDGAAPLGEITKISDYTSATGAFTHANLTAAVATTDYVAILHKSQLLTLPCADTSDPVDMTPEVQDHSALANLLTDDGDTSAYDRRTDSQEAISNVMGITVGGTLTGFEGDGTGVNLFKSLVAVQGYASGDGNAGGTTIVDALRTEGADYWNGHYITILSGANAGQTRQIVDDSGAGTLTIDPAFKAQVLTNVTYAILKLYANTTAVTGTELVATTTTDLNPGGGTTDLWTGTNQNLTLETLMFRCATGAPGGTLTSIKIFVDTATEHTLIGTVEGAVANLTSEAEISWTGATLIVVGDKIQITAAGGAAASYVCTVVARYKPNVAGGVLA